MPPLAGTHRIERMPRLARHLIRISHGRLELAVVESFSLDPRERRPRCRPQLGRLDDQRRPISSAARFRSFGRPRHGSGRREGLESELPSLRATRDLDGEPASTRLSSSPIVVLTVRSIPLAKVVQGTMLVPDFPPGDKGADWNDWNAKHVAEETSELLRTILADRGLVLPEATAPTQTTQADRDAACAEASPHRRRAPPQQLRERQ